MGPEVEVPSVAMAIWELPELFTVAPRVLPAGAWATNCQPLPPSPKTRAVPAVSVVTAGETFPGSAARGVDGIVVLTPEKAIVTIETWVGGFTLADGLASPGRTVTHATRRAPSGLAVSKTRVHPAWQLIEVKE